MKVCTNLRLLIAIISIVLMMLFVWHIDLSLAAIISEETYVFTNGFWKFNPMQIYHICLYGIIILTIFFGFLIIKFEIIKKEAIKDEKN